MSTEPTTNERIRAAVEASGQTRVEFGKALRLPTKINSQKQHVCITLGNWMRNTDSCSFRKATEQSAMLAELYVAVPQEVWEKLFGGEHE